MLLPFTFLFEIFHFFLHFVVLLDDLFVFFQKLFVFFLKNFGWFGGWSYAESFDGAGGYGVGIVVLVGCWVIVGLISEDI